jgi:hypothetical protein
MARWTAVASVSVPRLLAFGCCLSIVAWFAKGLPIVAVPKEILVPLVRDDVVDNVGGDVSILLGTRNAKGMRSQVAKSCVPPSSIVAALGCVGSIESLGVGLAARLAS